ncbi:MAG: hypothetical protein LBI19_06940 [Oscillospiraceae bacterium]|jgi:hypothetical protein|nr:hypothetical protein [Oscillospiraceae bacterium]
MEAIMDWVKDAPAAAVVIGALLALVLVYTVLRRIRRGVRRAIRNNPVSRALRQTGEIAGIIRAADMNAQLTPKSVSGGDSIHLPRILKDYPQFNVDLAKSVVENCIRDIFNALHSGDMSAFQEKYNDKVYAQCGMFLQRYGRITVTGLRVHRTAISDYTKHYGSSTIKFQTAFQYETAGGKDGKRINQERFETGYTFKVKDKEGGSSAALRCGHCGAPVARLGDKSCAYCGNEVILDLEQAWEITDINIK